MDKKILGRAIYNLNNTRLEKLIEDYKTSNNDLTMLAELIQVLKGSQLIVPVAFPKNADVRIVLKMLRGEPLKRGEELPMFPVTITDSKGNKYAPAFTARNKINETKDFPYMIRVPAEQVIRTATNENLGLEGVLLNPQTGGFIVKNKAFETDLTQAAANASAQPKKEIKKVSREQFIVLARNSVEKTLIPKQLFETKEVFVRQLEERGEEFLAELYAKPYGDKVPSPYTAEDFSVMSLEINDETTAICMELPKRGMAPMVAQSAYIVFNPKTNDVYYYLIERGQRGESDVLCSISQKNGHQEEMTAPPTGSELSAVLELIREEQEEA